MNGMNTSQEFPQGVSVFLWKGFVAVFVVVLMAGCAEAPPELQGLTAQEIQSVSARDLCEAYYYGQGSNVREELERRGLIPEADWPAVQKNIVRPGMRTCSVRAAWGAPNETVARTDAEVDLGMIYRRKGERIAVSLVDGRVTRMERTEESR